MNEKPQIIAFYLPQYYASPENDKWWGRGFTEWTNVGKAKPLFPGHYQPKVPADLGYYNLKMEDVREEQARLAKEAGISAFCYWHYWFEGKRLLEKPFNDVLSSGKPNFPFCLCWANHSWYAKTWRKDIEDKLLIEQTYGGEEDYKKHFFEVLPAFQDERYFRIDDKPVFGIYSNNTFSEMPNFIKLWQELALKNGLLKGIFFVSMAYKKTDCDKLIEQGVDAAILDLAFLRKSTKRYIQLLIHKILKFPQIVSYKDYSKTLVDNMPIENHIFPCIIPNFDHTPRSGRRGTVMVNSTPENWGKMLVALFEKMKTKSNNRNVIFLKSWNEWGEGNYLEPDLKYGKGYIIALKDALTDKNKIKNG